MLALYSAPLAVFAWRKRQLRCAGIEMPCRAPNYMTDDRYTIQLPARANETDGVLVEVRPASSLRPRRAVGRLAFYCGRREVHYDRVQFEAVARDRVSAHGSLRRTAACRWRAIRCWLFSTAKL